MHGRWWCATCAVQNHFSFKRIQLITIWTSIAQNVFKFVRRLFASRAQCERNKNTVCTVHCAIGREREREKQMELQRNKTAARRMRFTWTGHSRPSQCAKWWVSAIVPNRNGHVHRNYEQFVLFINYAVAVPTVAEHRKRKKKKWITQSSTEWIANAFEVHV